MNKELKIYLASRYSRREELLKAKRWIEEHTPHKVEACWLDGHHDAHGDEIITPADKKMWAKEDLYDVMKCDAFVVFTDEPDESCKRGGGGAHVETGIALAMKKTMILIGPCMNVFHWLEDFVQYDNWEQAKYFIRDLKE